jgi:hypothetical protein
MFPFVPALLDDVLVKELDVYHGIGRNLKTFPFDPLKRTFLQAPRDEKIIVKAPVNPRSSCRKIIVVSSSHSSPMLEKKKKKHGEKKKKKQGCLVVKKMKVSVSPKPSGTVRAKSPQIRRATTG